jgi:putative dimethyl sulfoxide reductase chaperone
MKNNHIEKALARKELYHWLSAAFYKPEEDFLQKEFAETLSEVNKILDYGLEDKIAELETSTKEENLNLEKLLIEYSHLFVGPSALLAPPYGSYYLDGGRVMGNSTLEVINFYRNSKMELLTDFKDLPDHIAVEISFLSHLCDFEAQALEQGSNDVAEALLQRQGLFLIKHLLPWLSEFTKRVQNQTELSFYKAAAAILEEALMQESKYLADKAVKKG